MNKPLEGRVALVTGASSGIGDATARALASAGADVAIAARRHDRLDVLARELEKAGTKVLVLAADLLVEEENRRIVAETEAHFGRLDILVNNAGVMLLSPVDDSSPADWRRMFELNMLAPMSKWPRAFKANAILTPHPGEMKRLVGTRVPPDDDGRIEMATRAARTCRQIIVLKGNRTVVTDGEKVYVNRTGDSSLSKAGTGDVLSGIIGALLTQGMDRFDAACAAVWIHGRAGELAGQKLGRRSVLARDVIDALPQAIAEYESSM